MAHVELCHFNLINYRKIVTDDGSPDDDSQEDSKNGSFDIPEGDDESTTKIYKGTQHLFLVTYFKLTEGIKQSCRKLNEVATKLKTQEEEADGE